MDDMIRTKYKIFHTKVTGHWEDSNLEGSQATGLWLWHEARAELLSELDIWRDTVILNSIISAVFHEWQGKKLEDGASLKLEIIYEEFVKNSGE